MKVDVDALKGRATSVYGQFTIGQRATLGVAAVALFILGYFVMTSSAPSTMTPLYSGLEASDAADVTTELDGLGVPYELADSGSTVLVDEDNVYRTRIELSAQGLPRGGARGYDLLDEQSITTSDFKQRIDYQRAMEGELARTISALGPVQSATVHLVMPEDDLFAADDVHPSASVLVSTGSATLDAGQVQAVVHLVASSVEGLVPEDVTVADDTGRVLNAPGEDGMALAAGEARLSQKLAYEAALARSIENDLLAPITGAGRARVVVSADMDFAARESVSETFADPETSPVAAENVTTETYTGDGDAVTGVLGTELIPVDGAGGTGTEYSREDAQRTYAVDKVTEQVSSAPGRLERLSVAVLVDEATGVDTDEISQLVSAGAGLVPDRGDSIEVKAMTFGEVEAPAGDEGTSSAATDDMLPTLLRTGGAVLLVLVVLLLAYRSAKKSSLTRYPLALPLPAVADELLSLQARLEEAGGGRELEPPLELTSHEPSPQLVLQNQIGELIDRQPEDVAAVLRTWLADRRS